MNEDKSRLVNSAMHYGLYLGAFWMIKYLVTVLAQTNTSMQTVLSFLWLGTPLLLFYFLVKYRIRILDGRMSFWHGVQFGVMLFLFASLLEAVTVFAHVTWIDPTFIAERYDEALATVQSLGVDESVMEAARKQPAPSPAVYTTSTVLTNIIVGMILSLLMVWPANRFEPKKNN